MPTSQGSGERAEQGASLLWDACVQVLEEGKCHVNIAGWRTGKPVPNAWTVDSYLVD